MTTLTQLGGSGIQSTSFVTNKRGWSGSRGTQTEHQNEAGYENRTEDKQAALENNGEIKRFAIVQPL